jgi:type II secretory pathway pseudopilin PulG
MSRLRLALYVLVPIALLAWVAIPNLLLALDRARQKRTMADMRTIATSWEARAEDLKTFRVHKGDRISHKDLERALVPTYTTRLPQDDAWGHPFQISTGPENSYSIVALAKDGKPDKRPYSQRQISDFETDLVYRNGNFVQYPEGI